jgi:hypothetical protein
MTEFQLPRSEAVAELRKLADERHVALVKGTARILMAWPFSAIATPFVVRARGRRYFANCSWDSVAFHAMLGEDIRVEALCHHCAGRIEFEMSSGRTANIEPAQTLVYLALKPSQWWEDIIISCSNTMVFFCSPEHRDASDLGASGEQAASLTPNQVHLMSVPLYTNRLEINYARPTGPELSAHFASLGLTGPFWQL